ncbi:MAG: methyltransferase domain-containing protein [bacterium]|nr:methyltransferase domain-containing protein [bacterium]
MDALAELNTRFYAEATLAFVRGRLHAPDLDAVDALPAARKAGLQLTKFKRSEVLPRVRRVIGALHALQPVDLLDVGTGRGAFLWPLLEALPGLPVTAIDRRRDRAADLQAVTRGGVRRLTAACMDVQGLALTEGSFDIVTMLEVLEHLEQPLLAAREAVRVARRSVVVSVPSHPDDNPEHLHLFTAEQIERIFMDAGASRVTVEHVLNHRIAVIRK